MQLFKIWVWIKITVLYLACDFVEEFGYKFRAAISSTINRTYTILTERR
jgi:hypothetical protein